jgi:uncharacterized membrane protein
MEISVLSKPASDLIAYGEERLCRWPVAALCLLVAGAALAVAHPQDLSVAAIRIPLAVMLIVQFRLWDDLADREHDRQTHPQRIMVRTSHLNAFRIALMVLALPVAALLVALDGPDHLFGYAGLILAVALVYRMPWRSRWLRNQVVLLKYPVFIGLSQAALSRDALLAAAVVYLAVTAYDWPIRKGSPQ